MLHDLAVKSTSHLLDILRLQTAKDAEITTLVQELPDDIEEQEKMLQVKCFAMSNNTQLFCVLKMYICIRIYVYVY